MLKTKFYQLFSVKSVENWVLSTIFGQICDLIRTLINANSFSKCDIWNLIENCRKYCKHFKMNTQKFTENNRSKGHRSYTFPYHNGWC